MVIPHFNSGIVPVVISTVVICIFLFSLYVTVKYRNPEQYKQTRINVFFSTLASVAIIFVGFNIVLSSISFEYNQHFTRVNKTQDATDKLWLYPNQVLKTSLNVRPEFLASFFMSNLDLYNMILLPNKKSRLTKLGIVEEEFIANAMLLAWSNCLTIRKYDQTPLDYWLRGFLTWAQNPYFKAYYERLKFGFDPNTVLLGDLLFEYAATIPVPTKDTIIYTKTIEKMMKDPRYISLLKALS
ncbi:MAG: hypothetical protein H0U73_08080 [Tatlockia sp.]|nr:hypothetical protein [Tatlockia sp.]